MKDIVINTLLTIAVIGGLIAANEAHNRLHAAKCSGCSWYWCEGGEGTR